MASCGVLVVLCTLAALAVCDYHGRYGGRGYHSAPDAGPNHHHYYGSVHHYHGLDKSYKKKQDSDESKSSEEETDKKDARVWYFQVGDSYGAYEYTDDKGVLAGFHIDLIKAVCGQANKRCHYILDIYTNCWQAASGIEHPGVGLLDHWYDGCVGYFPTPERLNSFNFTDAFTQRFEAALYVAADAEIENPKDLTGWDIGFVEGWGVNQRCLSRQGASLTGVKPATFKAHYYQTHDDMVTALKKKEINAILTEEAFVAADLGLKALDPHFYCAEGGSSVMTPYGSDLLGWWNEAFNDLVQTGRYDRLCSQGKKTHGAHGPIHCI